MRFLAALLIAVALWVEPALAASRFWVGGTGTWDAVTTTHWSGSSGGANGASVPGSSDTVTFDGSSGGGTVTVNTGPTITGLTTGAFTGTLDFSANNNSVSITGSTGFNNSGSGTRTINLGNGTWTISGTGTIWNFATTTGLTFNANSSVVNFTAVSASSKTISGGGLTYNTFTFPANSGGGVVVIQGANTFATLTISGQNSFTFPSSTTTTITNAFTWSGSSGSEIGVTGSTVGTSATISVASGAPTMIWAALRDMTFSGGATFTATSSFDLGHNSGITITAPTCSGGGGVCVLGGN